MKYLLLFFCGCFMMSCGGGDTSNKTKTTDTTSGTSPSVPTTGSNYFSLLRGSIGQYPITVYLYGLAHQYSGYYYYESQQKPIFFTGNDTARAGTITLSPYSDNDSTETFYLTFDGRKASGTWKMGSKSLPVSLSLTAMPVSFSYTGMVDSVRLTDTLVHSPVATATVSSIWPKGSTPTDNFIKQQIAVLFGGKQPQTDVTAMLQATTKAFLQDYKSDSSGITPADIEESPESLNYELDNDLRIVYQTPKLLVLSLSNYSFTGGVHGNFGTAYLLLDIQHNTVLQLEDLLTPEGIRQLRPLLESSYRRDQHLRPTQSLSTDGNLFENKIEPNKNFYVTGKGLIFSYTPYEIAPYAVGEITIMLGYPQLHNYLQPGFEALLN